MYHFAMLTPHGQLVETVHRSVNVWSRICGTLCGPPEISGGPRWESLP